MGDLKFHAQKVLQIQDASNLVAVLRYWGELASLLASREEVSTNAGKELIRHPLMILMASKVASMMVVNSDCIGGVEDSTGDLFRGAYEWAQREASDAP